LASRFGTKSVYLAGLGAGLLSMALLIYSAYSGVELSTIYAFAAGIAFAMGAWSFVVARRGPSPASLHPVPD
jgi:hypothetical protein